MVINNKTLDAFREDFKNVVKALEEKYDVEIGMGSITYNDKSFHFRTNVEKKVSDEDKAKNMQEEFNTYCQMYGFVPDDYRKEFRVEAERKTFILVGFNPRARKNACLLHEVGKEDVTYHAEPAFVKSCLRLTN